MDYSMTIVDLTKAMYFLNATDYRDTLRIEKIDRGAVFFDNGKWLPVETLTYAYNNYIKNGKVMRLF